MHDHRTCRMLRGQTSSLSAQKHHHVTTFRNGKRCLFHLFNRNYGFMHLYVFVFVLLITKNCHNSLDNHGRNDNHTFKCLQYLHIHKGFLKQLLQRSNFFNVSTSSTYQHLYRIHIFNISTSSTYQHLHRINIFNVSTSSTYQHLERIHIFNVSTSSMDPMQ